MQRFRYSLKSIPFIFDRKIIFKKSQQVQTTTHKLNQSTGGDAMTVKSLVVIDGEKIEIKDLKDKEAFADRVNR